MNGAMTAALRIQQQAMNSGFEWPSAETSLEKVQEELTELSEAVTTGDPLCIQEEYGDLLLAMTNVSLYLELDVMQCLQQALEKFNRRYQFILNELKQRSQTFSELTFEEKKLLWQAAKTTSYKNT